MTEHNDDARPDFDPGANLHEEKQRTARDVYGVFRTGKTYTDVQQSLSAVRLAYGIDQ